MELTEQERRSMNLMTGETICANLRNVLGCLTYIDYHNPKEQAVDERLRDVYSEGMRMHWSECYTPPTWKKRFHIEMHICPYCEVVSGAPKEFQTRYMEFPEVVFVNGAMWVRDEPTTYGQTDTSEFRMTYKRRGAYFWGMSGEMELTYDQAVKYNAPPDDKEKK